MSNVAINILAEFTGVGAFKKADKSVTKLQKSVKNLAGTLGLAFGTAAVVKFGKDAANAFITDQKEANRLATAVKNLGLEFSNPAISQYIDSLSKSSAVTDGQLRPAFQALLTTTGSLTKSQELLSQAIDISAGSGIELGQVAQDLASAYIGKTKALTKYNLGLTQAELKTAKFTDIQKKLNDQYKGANAAYLETYAGKMQALSTSAGEASEKIGGALIDSVMLLSGSSGIDDLITKIDKLADKTVGWIDKFSEGLALINAIKNSNIGNMSENIQEVQVAAYNARLRRTYMDAWKGVDIPKTAQQKAAEQKAEADAAKRAKAIADAQDKNTKELKKQTALKKAGTIFDLQQVQIIAALKGKISEEDRKRLELQFALLVGNEDEAKKLTYELAKAQGLGEHLANYLASLPDAKNPFASWEAYLDMLQGKAEETAAKIAAAAAGAAAKVVGSTTTTYVPSIANGYAGPGTTAYDEKQSYSVPATNVTTLPPTTAMGYAGAGSTAMAEKQSYVELRITGGDDIAKAVANSLQQQSLSTGNVTYINRRTGGFE
jgi:hypothetical protein